jgi:hypothetical protein
MEMEKMNVQDVMETVELSVIIVEVKVELIVQIVK